LTPRSSTVQRYFVSSSGRIPVVTLWNGPAPGSLDCRPWDASIKMSSFSSRDRDWRCSQRASFPIGRRLLRLRRRHGKRSLRSLRGRLGLVIVLMTEWHCANRGRPLGPQTAAKPEGVYTLPPSRAKSWACWPSSCCTGEHRQGGADRTGRHHVLSCFSEGGLRRYRVDNLQARCLMLGLLAGGTHVGRIIHCAGKRVDRTGCWDRICSRGTGCVPPTLS
jgi:hypothetical protein